MPSGYQQIYDEPPPYSEVELIINNMALEASSPLADAKSRENQLTEGFKAQYLLINRGIELRDSPEYHLVITEPLVTLDTLPSKEIVEHHIDVFLKRLYKKGGMGAAPLRFRNHKIERRRIASGEEKDELWVNLSSLLRLSKKNSFFLFLS
ncbi:hypothetical protein ABW19_dt0206587 [Dactylella cylindrospora]|nr:hypothetical protein ABW19_dt0206587 [Dactylella cylindrospora]